MDSRIEAMAYFMPGSKRNSAHDEEFFHCFTQMLDEAIRKLKEQGNADDINLDEDDQCLDEEGDY